MDMDGLQLSPIRVSALLDELCVKYGFCLSPGAKRRLENCPPRTIERFIDVVITIEGLDPRFYLLRDKMRAVIERHLVAAAEAEDSH